MLIRKQIVLDEAQKNLDGIVKDVKYNNTEYVILEEDKPSAIIIPYSKFISHSPKHETLCKL